MANVKNNTISKDKVLSAISLIIFVLLFIFSSLRKTLSIGSKLIGTFGFMIYPTLILLSLVCLIKFLGFSYKRSTKATILMIGFIYCLCSVIHSIRTFSVLDSVVSKETFVEYLALSYSKMTALGSFGSLFTGAIAFFIGGVGSIVTFVIAGTLFLGFFIDYELYGKYEEKHIKKIKTNKLRKKVMHSDDNLSANGTPNYSFSDDLDKYSKEDVVAEISANVDELSSDNIRRNPYNPNDVVAEISDNGYYTANSASGYSGNPSQGYGGYNQGGSNYYDNNSYFGRDAVTSDSYSNGFYSEPDYPDIYEEDEQRRQFMRATFDTSGSSSSGSSYSGYDLSQPNDFNYSSSIDETEVMTNNDLFASLNLNNGYNSSNNSYDSNSSYGSNDYGINSYGSDSGYNSNSYSNGYSSYNDSSYGTSSNFNQDNFESLAYGEIYNFPDSDPYIGVGNAGSTAYTGSESGETGYENPEYDSTSESSKYESSNISNSFGDGSSSSSYSSSSSNSYGSDNYTSEMNVEDKINNIVNNNNLDDNTDNFDYGFGSTSDITSRVKEDINNNYNFNSTNSSFGSSNSFGSLSGFDLDTNNTLDFLTESLNEVGDEETEIVSYKEEKAKTNIDTDNNKFSGSNNFNNTNNFASSNNGSQNQSNQDVASGGSKIQIASQKSQKKPFAGYNMAQRGIKYKAPPIEILSPTVKDTGNYDEEHERKAKGIEKVLNAFGIPVTVVNIIRGPKITRYELSVPLGISIKKIPNYELDIKKELAAKTISIKAPIPGSEFVGIELENDKFTNVGLRELFESDSFKNCTDPLPIAIGKDISGEIIVKSLTKMVHLLIAGQTGSGKSVFVHSTIMSLIYRYSPDDLRLVLIDPKRVEFNRYNGIPHLMTPEVVLGTEKSLTALKWCVKEMDRRFDLMSKSGYNHIVSYNNSEIVKSGQMPKFPYIVIIVDEFAEIMLANKKETDNCIQRITQLARACGMHLVLATQRPSVDVVSGVIKNNIPSRVAFSLSSQVDSRTIIGTIGAEGLLGEGDMLFSPNGTSVIQRLQAAYCNDEEIRKFIEYDKNNNEPNFDEAVIHMMEESANGGSGDGAGFGDGDMPPAKDDDEYLKVAIKMFIQKGVASGSYIQRRLSIGYSRAARIMDQLEDKGYIAPANGSKVRKVLMTPDQYKQIFHEDIDINGGDD